MAARDIGFAVTFGTLFASGETLHSFYGNENLPELIKSKWGTKIGLVDG